MLIEHNIPITSLVTHEIVFPLECTGLFKYLRQSIRCEGKDHEGARNTRSTFGYSFHFADIRDFAGTTARRKSLPFAIYAPINVKLLGGGEGGGRGDAGHRRGI